MRKAVLIALALLAAITALPLIAEQKNVKELTGLSDFELVRAMQEMSAGLGVNCDFCHARKGNDLDFASDDKKEKQTARAMIVLTKAANTSTFNGRSTVSCYTCHRGKEHPTGLVPLPVAPVVEEKEPAERPKMPSSEEVVKKYAEAVGNSARWENLSVKGTADSLKPSQPITFDIASSGGKIHAKNETPRGTFEVTLEGDHGQAVDPRGPRTLSASDIERFRYQYDAWQPVAPKEINTDPKGSRVIGKEKIGEHETYALFTSLGPKSRQRLYFDTTSGLLVRRVVLTDSPVGTIPSQTDFDDWKDVGGTKYPFLVTWMSPDARNAGTKKYSEVKFGK
jgi:hypothetical protein